MDSSVVDVLVVVLAVVVGGAGVVSFLHGQEYNSTLREGYGSPSDTSFTGTIRTALALKLSALDLIVLPSIFPSNIASPLALKIRKFIT